MELKMDSPNVIVLSGPNGAGKSTAAPVLLRGTLAVKEFVNADDKPSVFITLKT